jgi:hypothetical protein
MNYYIVPQETVDQYQDSVNDVFAIHFTEINTGEYVIDVNPLLTDMFSDIPWNTFEIRDLTNSAFQPDYTLPNTGNEAFIIPSEYQWLFPLDVNGYIVPIYDYEISQKILYKTHRDWRAMRKMLDSTELALLKKAITPFLSFIDSATIITI